MPPQKHEGNNKPAAAYDIKDWMQGMEKDAPKEEARSSNAVN